MYWSLKASKSISTETSRYHVSTARLLHTFNMLFLLHKIFKLPPTKPATADSLKQRPFLPLRSPSYFSPPQSLASKHVQPTDHRGTANTTPAPTRNIRDPFCCWLWKKSSVISTAASPPSWEYHQFPARGNGKEPLWLPGSLTPRPDQAPRAAASLGASPPPLKPDEQVEVWRYFYHALSTQHGPEAFSLLLNSLWRTEHCQVSPQLFHLGTRPPWWICVFRGVGARGRLEEGERFCFTSFAFTTAKLVTAAIINYASVMLCFSPQRLHCCWQKQRLKGTTFSHDGAYRKVSFTSSILLYFTMRIPMVSVA